MKTIRDMAWLVFALVPTNAFAIPDLLAELTFTVSNGGEVGPLPTHLLDTVSTWINPPDQPYIDMQRVVWQRELTPSDIGSVVSLPMALGENFEHPYAQLYTAIYQRDGEGSLESLFNNGWGNPQFGTITRHVPKIGPGLSGYDVWQTTLEIEHVGWGRYPNVNRWGWSGKHTIRIYGVQEPDYLDGDYNDDGSVDAADYVMARNGTGDLATWRSMFGATRQQGSGSALGAAIIPEPEACLLVLLALLFNPIRRQP